MDAFFLSSETNLLIDGVSPAKKEQPLSYSQLKRLGRENAERREKMEAAARAREAKERLLRESSMASDLQEAPSSPSGGTPLPRRMPAPAPLEILEGQWGRLHAATGASTPEGVIAFWQGRSKERGSVPIVPHVDDAIKDCCVQFSSFLLQSSRLKNRVF